uniref:Uncharacterized protein n=1 Tax=Cacopsylla melanoneura TaxID=428564 RepID=A0A8D9FJP4_9HEMI
MKMSANNGFRLDNDFCQVVLCVKKREGNLPIGGGGGELEETRDEVLEVLRGMGFPFHFGDAMRGMQGREEGMCSTREKAVVKKRGKKLEVKFCGSDVMANCCGEVE